jgi:predicted NAD/FAD-binding protein
VDAITREVLLEATEGQVTVARRRIAVVGSGVAGLTAAHVLQRDADVTLYEADARLGGHADTHDVPVDGARALAVDTGFIVHNKRTYPTLLRLFAELGVSTQESDMSMSIACSGCGLEYAGGRGLSGLLPSARTVSNPRYLRMLTQVRRFHRRAQQLLDVDHDARTLSQFLRDNGFGPYFERHFVTPLVSAVWSTAPSRTGEYPARYLFSFLQNHGMLQVTGSPVWYTVVGGSARYVERVAKNLSAVQTSTPVRSVRRAGAGVEVRAEDDSAEYYDGVVLATHPHQALAMLDEPTPQQRELLGGIGYTVNPTLLHTDVSVLPTARRAQASWNYVMDSCDARPETVQVSYNMNRLQRLDELGARRTYVVTLNGERHVDPATVIDRMSYEHPVYTTDSVAARTRLPALNDGVLAFAGAYHGWGFHEDGARSGVDAATSLGAGW